MAITRTVTIGDSDSDNIGDNAIELHANSHKLITPGGTVFQINSSDQPVFLPASIPSAADDAAAAALTPAVPVGGLYRTASAVKIRVA